ncbi:MAG: UMP kinase [Candidatus Diapherotrites archaeon]
MFDFFNEMPGEKKEETPYESQASPSSNESLFVVSVGGSTFIEKKLDTALLSKIASTISSLEREGYKFVIVVGGGKICRDYVAAAKTLGANNFELDELGVMVTRVNAQLFIHALDNAFQKVLTEVKDAKKVLDSGKIPVFGGLLPGFTTDAVAALIAESLNAVFINLTNVDGVYSANPKLSAKATFYKSLDFDRLLKIVLRAGAGEPGANVVLDINACNILKRSKIPTIVLNADDLPNFEAAVRHQEFRGTLIRE